MTDPTPPGPPPAAARNALLLLALLVLAVPLLGGGEAAALAGALRDAPLAVALSLAAHVPQVALGALAWWVLLRPRDRPALRLMLLLRWFREAADALLPAGAVVGQAAGARTLVRRGMPPALATATGTAALATEAAAQFLFTLGGLALLLLLGAEGGGGAFAAGLALAGAGALALAILLSDAAMRLAQAIGARLRRRFPRLDPAFLGRLRESARTLRAGRGALLLSAALNLAAWLMGAVEIMLVLGALGHPVGLAEAVVIESLAQVLRNAGFLLPGAAGVQEAAIVAAAAIFGVPPTVALAAALARRAREVVLVGLPGLVAWRRAEQRGAGA